MQRPRAADPLPLSRPQLEALAAAAARELLWGLPQLSRETRRWLPLAERIPEAPLRADALRSLNRKRGNMAGAVIFTILPSQRSRDLLRALFAHQVAADFLDNAHERHPTAANGYALHLAVTDALAPGRPPSDYYAHHPWRDDGGYLAALVAECQRRCAALPSFAVVQPLLTREAERARHSLTLNHLPDPAERDSALRRLAADEYPGQDRWHWFELTAAMCGQLGFFLLLALAATPDLEEREAEEAYDAYWPYVPMLATMLDSFVDQAEDGENGNHRYVSHYPEPGRATERLAEAIEAAAGSIMGLPNGHRHAVILACMVAFYLAKDSAQAPALSAGARRLADAGGSLSRTLLPILRIWRRAYSQRTA